MTEITKIYTRIKHKIDTLANWEQSDCILENGELAIVRNANSSDVELSIKVGDGEHRFTDLPWLSAKSSIAAGDFVISGIIGSDDKTLSQWLSGLSDSTKTNAAQISSAQETIATLSNSVNQLAADIPSTIQNKIAELDCSDSEEGTKFVTAVAQTDGKISITKRELTVSDLPEIPTSKVRVSDLNLLSDTLGNIESRCTSLASEITRVENAIEPAITGKINSLDYSSVTDLGDFITNVAQTDGKVTVTKGTFPVASTDSVGIVQLCNSTTSDSSTQAATANAVKQAYDKASSALATAQNASDKLDSLPADTVVNFVTNYVTDEINKLDFTDPNANGTATEFITSVSQGNGKIEATKASLPIASLNTAGIVELSDSTGSNATNTAATSNAVSKAYSEASNARARAEQTASALGNVTNVSDFVSNQINSALADLTVTSPGAELGTNAVSFIDTINQTNGKISATKKTIYAASASQAGILKLNTDGGAAKFEDVSDLKIRMATNEGAIEELRAAVANGVHFIGETLEAPNASKIIIKESQDTTIEYTAKPGDIVIFGNKEFINIAADTWKEFGDLNNLDITLSNCDFDGGDYGDSKFVSKITQEDGKVSAEYSVPSAKDITYSNGTVESALGNHGASLEIINSQITDLSASVTKINGTINNLNCDSVTPMQVPTDGYYVTGVTQTNGLISVFESPLPQAGFDESNDSLTAGVVKLKYLAEGINNNDKGIAASYADISIIDTALNTAEAAIESLQDTISGLDFSNPEAEGQATEFITSVSQENGQISAAKASLPTASTSVSGIVTLYDGVDKSDAALAATANAVKTVNQACSAVSERVATIEGNYIRFVKESDNNDNIKLYCGSTDTDEIIFDCGGAPIQ